MRVLRLNYFVVRSSTLENRMLVGQVLLIPNAFPPKLIKSVQTNQSKRNQAGRGGVSRAVRGQNRYWLRRRNFDPTLPHPPHLIFLD